MIVSGMAALHIDPEYDENFGKVVNGLSEESEIDEEMTKVNIDKIHPISDTADNGKQQRIIKFQSDSLKKKYFRTIKT